MEKIEERYVGFDLEPEFAKKQSSSKKETVDHPDHYNKGIEVINQFFDQRLAEKITQTAQRLLRHSRPGTRPRQAPGRGRPANLEAQHWQPSTVWLRSAGRDFAGRDAQPAHRPGLL